MTTLIRHPEDVFQVLYIDEVYLNKTGAGAEKRVANQGDMIINKEVGIYFVTAVSADTDDPVPSLELVQRFANSSSFNSENNSLITSMSIYDPSVATSVFVDNTVDPITATIDERWRSFTGASHGVLFLGTDTSPDKGEVISARYNSAGNFISNDIPYEVIDPSLPKVTRPLTFNLTHDVTEQVVTLVDYNAVGDVVGKRPFLIEHSSFIRPANDSDVQLIGFNLKSIMMDPNDATRIINPINVPIDMSMFTLELLYSDGSSVKDVLLDGSRAVIHGIDNFNSTVAGRPKSISVSYYPNNNEPFLASRGSSVRPHITKNYLLANEVKDTSFSLKLFCVPKFVSTIAGYTLDWYLLNLERDIIVDVSDHVGVTVRDNPTGVFTGKEYGVMQTLDLRLVTDTVLPGIYPGHVHTQRIALTLNVPGATQASPWAIDYILDGNYILGSDEYASCSTVNDGSFDISNDISSFETWLYELYQLSLPLYDERTEVTEPTPTHVELMYEGSTKEIDLADWENVHLMPAGSPVFAENKTVVLKWITRTGDGDLYHAVTPLLVRLDL